MTGGAGFIGSALCRHLVGEGHTVVNVDKLTYAGNLASLSNIDRSPNYTFIPERIFAMNGRCARLWLRTLSIP